MSVVVAAFDVDNTLTVRDCVAPFLFQVSGRARTAWSLAGQPVATAKALRSRDRDALKRSLVRGTMAGLEVSQVEERGARFALMVSEKWIRRDVAGRFRWHQEQGHVVVLVSASLSAYLLPLGDLLEADGVLCTELDERDGVLTGEIRGENCRGGEKIRRLHSWMTTAGMDHGSLTYAYGDSRGDDALLAAATHGHRVDKIELSREWRP